MKKNLIENQYRDLSLDIAKGIGIILVVIGHCVNTESLPGKVIYSFHMPLFFIISGILFNPKINYDFQMFCKKRAKQLLIPAFYFTVLSIGVGWLLGEDTTDSIKRLSWEGLPVPLWFLVDLFLVELSYWVISVQCKYRKFLEYLVIFTFLILGMYSSQIGLCNPYSLFSVLSALFFYSLGCLLRNMTLKVKPQLTFRTYSYMGIFVILFVLSLIFGGGKLNMYENKINFSAIPVALLGSLVVLFISKVLISTRNKKLNDILIWLGQNSLIVLGVHCLFIRFSSEILKPLFCSYGIYKCIEQIVIWLGIYICVIGIKKYVPWIVGK